jgi:hypothetical protein
MIANPTRRGLRRGQRLYGEPCTTLCKLVIPARAGPARRTPATRPQRGARGESPGDFEFLQGNGTGSLLAQG